jgi:hypothetical protein
MRKKTTDGQSCHDNDRGNHQRQARLLCAGDWSAGYRGEECGRLRQIWLRSHRLGW